MQGDYEVRRVFLIITSVNYCTKTIIILLRLSEYCRKIPSTLSLGLFNNIHVTFSEYYCKRISTLWACGVSLVALFSHKSFGIIAQVMRMLWLVYNCVISCYNHPARGDYNTEALIFENGYPHNFLMFLKKKQINERKCNFSDNHLSNIIFIKELSSSDSVNIVK